MIRLYLLNIFGGRKLFGKLIAFLFLFGVPILVAVCATLAPAPLDPGSLSIMVSAFSIFSAMLFASQVAAFSVFNYKILEISSRPRPDDAIAAAVDQSLSAEFSESLRQAFRRINGGISILTMVAVIVVLISVVLSSGFVAGFNGYFVSTLGFLVAHFVFMFLYMCYQVFSFFDTSYTRYKI